MEIFFKMNLRLCFWYSFSRRIQRQQSFEPKKIACKFACNLRIALPESEPLDRLSWNFGLKGFGTTAFGKKINILKIAIFPRAKFGKFESSTRFSSMRGLSEAERRGNSSRGNDFSLKNNYGGEKGVKYPFLQFASVGGLFGAEFRADCSCGVKSCKKLFFHTPKGVKRGLGDGTAKY